MRRASDLATVACALLVTAGMTHAQAPIPGKPIRILVGFTPGSGTDFLARTVGQKTSESCALIDLAKARPGQITYATGGMGTSTHVNTELFSLVAGISMVHIPYKGAPEILSNVLSGNVNCAFSPISSAAPFVTAGRLAGLALSSGNRSPVLPNVPTLAESALPGFDFSGWYAMFAPAGTPKSVKDKLSSGVATILALPDTKERLLTQGATPKPTSPEKLDAFVKEEIARMAKLVQAAGIRVE